MNPVASTPVFITLTERDDAATKRSVAVRSLAVAFGIFVVVSIAGNLIFKLFGISLGTLRITGGIVLFIIGYQMLQVASSHSHKPSDAEVAESKEAQLSVAVSPLIPDARRSRHDRHSHDFCSRQLAAHGHFIGLLHSDLWGDLLLLSLLRSASGVPWTEWHECGDAFDGVDRGLDRGGMSLTGLGYNAAVGLICIGSRLVFCPISLMNRPDLEW